MSETLRRPRTGTFWPVMALTAALSLPGLLAAQDGAAPARGDEGVSLGEFVVNPRKTVLDEGLEEQVLLGADVWKQPLVDNDLFRAVQAHPGVAGGDFSARFRVRGGDADETLVLLDGMELYSPFHLQDFGGALSVLDLLAVSRAHFFAGAFPAEFGDRLSAVLDVKTRDPAERPGVDAGVDLLNAHLFVHREPFFLAARAGYIGLLMGLMDSEESFEPHYGDVLFKITEDLSPRDEVSATLLWAVDTNRIEKAGVDEDVRSRFHNGTAWLKWRRTFDGEASLETYVYGGGFVQRRRNGPADHDDRDLAYGGAKTVFASPWGESLFLQAGLDLRGQVGHYDYLDTDRAVAVEADPGATSLRGFLSSTVVLAKILRASLGSRILYLDANGALRAAPVAALSLEPGNGVAIRAAVGLHFQPVDPLHLPVEAGVSRLTKPEKALHGILGLEVRPAGTPSYVRLEFYFKKREDLVGYIPDFGRQNPIFLDKDGGTATGVELTFVQGVGTSRFHATFAYALARDRFEGEEYWAEGDRRYAADLGASVDAGSGWWLYAGWRFHAGEPWTRVWYVGTTRFEGERNGARLPPYHSLDLRLSKVWKWRGMEIQAYLQVLNLYARDNVHEYVFVTETVAGVTTTQRQAETLIPLLPTLGVNVSF